MPNLSQVRDRVDNWLEGTVWPLVLERQEIYKDGVIDHWEDEDSNTVPEGDPLAVTAIYSVQPHGVYFQGLRTHAIEPNHLTADFADTLPTELDGQLHDQVTSWMDFIPEINVAMPAIFVSDVYEAPAGHGFVLSVFMRYNGTLYSRSQNHGPETYRTKVWHAVVEEE